MERQKGERDPDRHLHLANKCKFSFFETGKQQKKPGLNENSIAAFEHGLDPSFNLTFKQARTIFSQFEIKF